MNQGSQLKKESGISIEQRVSAQQGFRSLSSTRIQGSQMNKVSQLNKESGVSIEQGVPAEQRVRGL